MTTSSSSPSSTPNPNLPVEAVLEEIRVTAPHPVTRWLSAVAWPLGALMLMLGLWAASNAIFKPVPYLYPSPGAVWEELTIGGRSILESTLITLQGATAAFVLSAVLGAVIALLLSALPVLYKSFFPYTVLIQTIPVIAVAPIVIIWFGIGLPSIVVIALIIAIFPVIANTTVGLRSTDASMQQLFTLYGATSWQTLFKLRFPYALPYFFTGLRIAAGGAVIGAVVGEYMAGMGGNRGGLGFLIAESASRNQMARLFAAAIAASVMGLLFTAVVGTLNHRFLHKWHESARQ
jgi:NitT/TauT family transport system permease protein